MFHVIGKLILMANLAIQFSLLRLSTVKNLMRLKKPIFCPRVECFENFAGKTPNIKVMKPNTVFRLTYFGKKL